MADVRKFQAPGNYGGGDRYIMHDDAPDVRKDNSMRYNPKGEEWAEKHEHPEGVTQHVHKYGSSLYVTHAPSKGEATTRIHAAEKRWHSQLEAKYPLDEGNQVYSNPKFAFSPENRGKVKPVVIKGGKE